jgi:addiction module RelB/DinJ family antitoxin
MPSTFSIRLDDETKKSMETICENIGISMSSAFYVFAKAFVREEGFPFDLKYNSKPNPMEAFRTARRILREQFPEEPTLDEINEEIRKVRESRNAE